MTHVAHDILLVAVNARYSHCAYAARSLQANLGGLATSATLLETDLNTTPLQLAAQIVEARPRIVGFTVYLWNVRLIETTAHILRAVAPNLRLIAGGPELIADYAHAALFDAIVIGEGETAFRTLCENYLSRSADLCPPPTAIRPPSSVLCPRPEDPATLALPYHLYTDADLAQRIIYVEASRGCPFACTYCTSADTGLRLIPLERLLPALDTLWQRGLRRFKFLDRSFNAPSAHASALLDFFLDRATPDMQLHFEINPDYLHAEITSRIAAFPQGTLHLEAGIQTLNPQAAAAIGRSADTAKTLANLRLLTRQASVTVHADLIFGLPGEDEASFARGFNMLIAEYDPPEVQVNLLKGLPGTRLLRDAPQLGLAFSPEPPYELLHSDVMSFNTLVQLQRFARSWELVHNRGRFPHIVQALHTACGTDIYDAYRNIADRIHNSEGKLFAISMPRLASHLRTEIVETYGIDVTEASRLVAADLNAKPPS